MAVNPTLASPLTNADLAQLNRALYLINQLQSQFDKASAAGFDVTEMRLRAQDLQTQTESIKAAYFPSSQ